jgi:hypothetical protein
MNLLTSELRECLLLNGIRHLKGTAEDFMPVVKFFNPCGAATWLITEMDPNDNDTLFGLCDLGMGFPELGYVSLQELASIRLPFGLTIERDHHFYTCWPLSVFAEAARKIGCITEKEKALALAAASLSSRR